MKKILIIGAGFLQKFVIQKAKELGYYTLCVDGNPSAEGYKYADEYAVIDIVDSEACLAYAKEKQIDGVLTAATDYGVLTVSYIAEQMGLRGNNFISAKLIKNKYQVRKRLFEACADDTEQAYEVKNLDDLENIKKQIKYPVMVKPCDGSGSRGASKVNYSHELENAVRDAIKCSLTRCAEIESFIVGQEYGVESLVIDEDIYVMAVMQKKMTAPPYYAELGHQIPSGLGQQFESKIKACVKKAIKALGVTFGAVNMDLLITDEQKIHIVDVGARMGGNLIGSHIIGEATGIDYLGNLIRATMRDEIIKTPIYKPKAIATRLLALTPGEVIALPDCAEIENKFSVNILHHLKVGEKINEYHTNLDGCGYIVAQADTIEEAESNADCAKKWFDEKIVRG